MSTRRHLPMAALQAFDLAARLGSFTRAAARLGITQSAITRQIARLEDSLGTRLFHRGRRGVALTRDGETFRAEIAPAFQRIELAASRLREHRTDTLLRLRAYPTFAAQWLLPRLPAFGRRAPAIEIAIDTTIDAVDFERDPIDLAIQFLPCAEAPAGAERLIADEIAPVCSPAFLASHQAQIERRDLAGLPIIQTRYRRADWRDWTDSQELGEPGRAPAFEFPSSMLAYRAALLGLGLAIGQIPLLRRELDEGLLVCPWAAPLRRDMAYYLLLARADEPESKVRTFVAWLREEIARGP